jgi:hypothetical protein
MLSHLAISREQYYLNLVRRRCPGMWMVTGLQYIKSCSIQLNTGSSGSTGADFTLPIPTPLPVPVPSTTGAVSLSANIHQKSEVHTTYGHADERVWAAQYMKLVPKLKEGVVSKDSTFKWVKLQDLIDLGDKGARKDEEDQDTPDVYAAVDSAGLREFASVEDMQKEVIEDTTLVDWEFVERYLEQEKALREDAEDL